MHLLFTIANQMEAGGVPGMVHITQSTFDCLHDEYEVQEGNGAERNSYLREKNVKTYFIIPPQQRRKVCNFFIFTQNSQSKFYFVFQV